MDKLLLRLRHDYPQLDFVRGVTFCWSPATGQIFYSADPTGGPSAAYSVLHELAHALLKHNHYANDYELLRLEIAAWEHAKLLAKSYGMTIDDEHIQNCIDSYRDWLYKRSICPTCGSKCLQCDDVAYYRCFNCQNRWRVTASKFCRPYRFRAGNKKSPTVQTAVGDFSVII